MQRFKFLDKDGHEIPDNQPIEVPAGFKRPETLAEQVRRLVQSEQLASAARAQNMETFDESEDFEIDDEMWDPHSAYEEVFDPVIGRAITLQEFHDNHETYRQRFVQAEEAAQAQMDLSEALRARPKRGTGQSPVAAQEAPDPAPAPPKAI